LHPNAADSFHSTHNKGHNQIHGGIWSEKIHKSNREIINYITLYLTRIPDQVNNEFKKKKKKKKFAFPYIDKKGENPAT